MRNHNRYRLLRPILAVTMALGTASLVAADAPEHCASPRAASELYPPAPGATGDRTTWKGFDFVTTNTPAGAQMRVGYRGASGGQWNDSYPMIPAQAKNIAVLVGDGPVQLGVQFEGSCSEPLPQPNTVFPSSDQLRPRNELTGFFPTFPGQG